MAIQTTSNLSNAIRTRYIGKYIEAAGTQRVYDMFAKAVSDDDSAVKFLGNSYQYNFLSEMAPGVTTISETADVTPQILVDATATFSPTDRGEAIEWAEKLDLKAYTNYGEQRFGIVGRNMMESVDLLAQAVALQGGLVFRNAARASLDAGTSGDRLTDASFGKVESLCQTLKIPAYIMENGQGRWFAAMHNDTYYDLRTGGNVVTIAQYQKGELILGYNELGVLGKFKLVVTPFAKVFGAAGADNGSNVATTLSTAGARLDKTIVVASATNITSGMYLTIGTEETGNTFYPANERVRVSANYVSGTTIDIIGEGSNGGLKYAHDSAVAVRNADSVYPVAFGGAESLVKVFASEQAQGEYGTVVGPAEDGLLAQFRYLGWKFYGGYGRITENSIVRGEFSSSIEA